MIARSEFMALPREDAEAIAVDAALSAILAEPARLDEVRRIVAVADFPREADQVLYAMLLRLATRGAWDVHALIVEAGATGLLDRVGGRVRLEYLVGLGVSPAMAAVHAKTVREAADRRDLEALGEELARESRAGEDVAGLIARAEGHLALVKASGAVEVGSALAWAKSEALRAEPDEDPADVLWHGIVALGLVTLFAAAPKVGKSWLLHAFLAALSLCLPWLGNAAGPEPVRAVVVSEEARGRLRKHARRFGAVGVEFLPRGAIPPGMSWPALVEAAAAHARKVGARVLVFDTIGALAGLADENDAAEVNAAFRPLLRVADAHHLAVLAVHHARKDEAAGGRGIRGSSVFAGAPDVLVEVRRVGGEDSRQRSLSVLGRLEAPERAVVVEHIPGTEGTPDTYRMVGGMLEVALERAAAGVLKALGTFSGWMREGAVTDKAGVRAADAQAALRALVPDRVHRRKVGRAYVYALPGIPETAPVLGEEGEAQA